MSDTVRAKRLVHRDPPWVDKLYDVIDEMYQSHKRETRITQKKTFAPSSIGYGHGRCAKYWYMAFSGEHEFEDTTTARSIAIMSNGTYTHSRLQKLIGESGIVVVEEEEMLISDPPIRGFADLILKIQLDDETVIPVIEIKSTMQEAFVHRQATHKPSPYHLIQLLIYLKATGLTEGAILYENKNTQEILIIPVKMDDKNYELIERVFEWLRTVYSAYEQGLEPRRPVKRRDSVICKQCPLRKACWDGEDKGVIDIPIMEMPKL